MGYESQATGERRDVSPQISTANDKGRTNMAAPVWVVS
jgi:hypothetical protein